MESQTSRARWPAPSAPVAPSWSPSSAPVARPPPCSGSAWSSPRPAQRRADDDDGHVRPAARRRSAPCSRRRRRARAGRACRERAAHTRLVTLARSTAPTKEKSRAWRRPRSTPLARGSPARSWSRPTAAAACRSRRSATPNRNCPQIDDDRRGRGPGCARPAARRRPRAPRGVAGPGPPRVDGRRRHGRDPGRRPLASGRPRARARAECARRGPAQQGGHRRPGRRRPPHGVASSDVGGTPRQSWAVRQSWRSDSPGRSDGPGRSDSPGRSESPGRSGRPARTGAAPERVVVGSLWRGVYRIVQP